MMKKISLFLLLFFLLTLIPKSYVKLLDQKKGVDQDNPHKQKHFVHIQEFRIDPQKVILSAPIKIIKHQNKIFILDRKQCRIFVFNPHGEFLFSIGQPGQGPGDLEYPRDFYISSNNIFVLNSTARRIEVFSLEGKFKKRIKLTLSKDNFFSYPTDILIGQNGNIYISYNLNKNLVDSYNPAGEYEYTLLERKEQIVIPGKNLGNSSHIQFSDKGNAILHFNYFTGVFTKVSLGGKILAEFSAYDKIHKKASSRIINDLKKSSPKIKTLKIEVFELWSDCFCLDDNGEILAVLLLKEKNAPQKIYVFSENGVLKYFIPMKFFVDDPVRKIFFSEGQYFLLTQQNKIYTAQREVR